MRTLVLSLLIANVALLVWSSGVLRPLGLAPADPREPARLQRQFHPELVQPLPVASAPQR